MITLDTGAVFAILNQRDAHHTTCVSALDADPGPYLLPCAAVGEIAWLIEPRLPPKGMDALLEDIARGGLVVDCGEHDIGRVQELVLRYRDLGLGLVDAAVMACAERNGGRCLTTDRRHFPVVARGERTLTILPE